MNGSLPAFDASLSYLGAGEDPFDFDLFDVLARESSPPSLASGDQDSSPATSGRTGVGRLGSRDAPPCATFHNYVAQLDGMADGLCELLPPPPDLGAIHQARESQPAESIRQTSSGADAASRGTSASAPKPAEKRPNPHAGRDAQRRYRQRKRDRLATSEDQLAELQAQINALTLDKAKLANSNELLERSILRTQQQDDHAHVEPHGKKVAWCPGGCGRTVGGDEIDSHTYWLMEQANNQVGDELEINIREGAPIRITRAQLAASPPEDVMTLFNEYVLAMAECLLKGGDDPDTPAGRRLEELVEDEHRFRSLLLGAGTEFIQKLKKLASSRSGNGSPMMTDETAVRELVKELELSDEQVQVLLAMRRLYLQNMGALQRRREELAALVVPDGDSLAYVLRRCHMAQAHSRTAEAVEHVRDLLRSQRSFTFQLWLTLSLRVFTPVQAARIRVRSYPALNMDSLTFLNMLAKDNADPSAEELMRQGAVNYKALLLPVDVAMTAASKNGPLSRASMKEEAPCERTVEDAMPLF